MVVLQHAGKRVVRMPRNVVMQEVFKFADTPQTGFSLRQLLEFGYNTTPETLQLSANTLRHELPIRLAHRIKELGDLPHGLSNMPSVQKVRELYIQSWEEIFQHSRINSQAEELEFNKLLIDVKSRHGGTLLMMAKGVHELKQSLSNEQYHSGPGYKGYRDNDILEMTDLHTFLDRFYMSRIAIRMLIGQHIALHDPRPGWSGNICENVSPAEIAYDAIDTARYMCDRQYGAVPDVTLLGETGLTFPYVPSHLHHMLFEVLKNSLRATVEFHGEDSTLPDVRVIVSDGEANEDVSIKISDEGGGIPRSHISRIWSYTYTTMKGDAFASLDEGGSDYDGGAPLAGLGYGLPISRLFARYFGGDLTVISMEGYGTDAYMHLRRAGNSSEPLP